jgi:serine/threonine protein phosphatase PrpC
VTIALAHAAATDIGLQRTTNEDAYLAQPPLFAVADGLGGHSAGEIASRLAIDILSGWAADGREALTEAVKEANRSVHEQAASDPELHGMGTTVTALLAADSSIQIVHVGDSRAYLFREGDLRRLTQDHTLAERLVREGRITSDEADRHPQRSILERAVGVSPEVEVDVYAIDILPGDRLLLCTDGLTSMLSDPEIRTVLAEERDPEGAAGRLVAEAVRAGGRDNVTTLVVDYPDEDGTPSDVNKGAEKASAGSAPAPSSAAGGPPTTGPPAPGPLNPRPSAPQRTVSPPGPEGVRAASRPGPATVRYESPRGPAQEAPEASPRRERRGFWGRPMTIGLAVGTLILLVAGGGLGSRWLLSNSWYVGERGGMVAVYRGIPGSFGGIELSSLQQRTDVPVDTLPDYYQRQLEEGITADDRAQAEEIVRDISKRARPPDPLPGLEGTQEGIPGDAGPGASPPGPPPASPS